MIAPVHQAARRLLALCLLAAAGSAAWADVTSADAAAYGTPAADRQPSQPTKDGSAQASAPGRAVTRAADGAASTPVRRRWIVPAE